MSRIAHHKGGAATLVMIVAVVSADAFQLRPQRTCTEVQTSPSDVATRSRTPPPKRQRIRSVSGSIVTIIDQGYERSATFGRLIDTLEQSPVLVYIEPGRCPAIRRQRLNGCLVDLGTTGGARHVRITVDVQLPTDLLIATVGHELQHAVEVAQANPGTHEHRHAFSARSVGANVYETDAAQDVKTAVLRDLRHSSPSCPGAPGRQE